MTRFASLAIGLGFAAFAATAPASAAVITGVTVSDVSSQLYSNGAYAATNVLNGVTDTTSTFNMWLTSGNPSLTGSAPDANPFITFNLGALYSLASMNVWNYNEAGYTNRGVSAGLMSVSTNGTTFNPVGAFTLNQAPGTTGMNYSQTLALNTSAQYVRISNLADFLGADAGLVGLTEVQFNSTSNIEAVPEPLSIIALTTGLVALGATRRRSRQPTAQLA